VSRLAALVFLAGAAVLLSTGSAASQAAASKRAGTIAFIRLENGPVFGGRLFVVRPDGGGLRQLTPQGTTVYSYAWSPDGKLIAYIDERRSLWLVRPDGARRRMLLPSSQLSSLGFSWSPDGKNIAIVSPGASANPARAACAKLALYVVPVGGGLIGGPEPVLVSAPRRGIGCGVAWSPRGGEIAYGDGGEVLGVISSNGGRPRLLLTSGGVGAPHWSPDGTKLAAGTIIHRGERTDRSRRITVVDADGSDPHVVTDHAYTEYPFAWAPDSRRILYGRHDRQGIYVIGADGRNNHRVTRDAPPQAGWGALAWSPTGGSIVYTAGGTDNTDLYLIGIDGRGKFQLTSTPDIDIDPSWVSR
jgi:Tol biopolymer transport system component